jgi:hypothetical protein
MKDGAGKGFLELAKAFGKGMLDAAEEMGKNPIRSDPLPPIDRDPPIHIPHFPHFPK